jgi:hypothetical protein
METRTNPQHLLNLARIAGQSETPIFAGIAANDDVFAPKSPTILARA